MEFTKFIDSRDITEHLKKLDYKFTAPEAAYLVYQSSRAILEEKFTAWEYIIENFPDCSMERRSNMNRIDSFHEFLRKYIDLQKRKILSFSEPGKHVYTALGYGRYGGEEDYIFRSHGGFSTFDICLAFCSQQIHESEEDKLGGITIRRLLIDSDQYDRSYLELNTELKILDVEVSGLSDEDDYIDIAFDGMAFAFPTPFERGDILIVSDRVNNGDIFVLDHLPTWDGMKCAEQKVRDRVSKRADRVLDRLIKTGDESHMYAYGYEFVEDGIYYDDFGMANYLKCEYLREPLKGKQRVLKPLSSFMKGRIEEELLCRAYHYILLEEDLAIHHRFFFREYLKEALNDVGILAEKSPE